MTPYIEEIKKQVIPLSKKYHCKKMALFGSYVKGLEKERSDIDILVEPPPKFGLIKFSRMKLDLEKILQKHVDLVTYKSISPYMKKDMLQSAYTLYEE